MHHKQTWNLATLWICFFRLSSYLKHDFLSVGVFFIKSNKQDLRICVTIWTAYGNIYMTLFFLSPFLYFPLLLSLTQP